MKYINKKYKINVTPEEIYNAITNPFNIELLAGDISRENLEIIANKKPLQELYFGKQPE